MEPFHTCGIKQSIMYYSGFAETRPAVWVRVRVVSGLGFLLGLGLGLGLVYLLFDLRCMHARVCIGYI